MTTDDFTEAASTEVARLDDQYDLEWESPCQVFVRGAEWARAHLAAQEPNDAEVEEVAERMKEQAPQGSREWPEWVWTRFARVALTAARAARPDEEKR